MVGKSLLKFNSRPFTYLHKSILCSTALEMKLNVFSPQHMIIWMTEIDDSVISEFDVFFRVWKNVIFEQAHNSTQDVENKGESTNNCKLLFSNVY